VTFVSGKPLGAFGGAIVLLMVLLAVFADVIATHDPTRMQAAYVLQPPGSTFWLGTDTFGRDMFSRIIYGARVSLFVGFSAAGLGVAIGTAIGILSGYLGGKTDLAIQRVIDVMLAFPSLLLALIIAAVLGAAVHNVVLALTFPLIPRAARLARASTLVLKQTTFVDAAVALGCGTPRILLRHVLPNCFAPLIIITTAYIGTAITAEAGLSFLGLGTREPNASWGLMLANVATAQARDAPWLALFPGIALSLAVFGFNLLGDALRDVLDPRLRGVT
jgi:peptide/nickel transport system permease protein